MPIDMTQMVFGAPDSPDPYRDWTDADWNADLRRAMQPQSRPSSRRRGEYEYMVGGNWIPQGLFNDPQWRQNVYDPWSQGIQDEWRNKREDWEMNKRGRRGARSMFSGGGRPPGRSAGRMGSRSAGPGQQAATGSRSTSRRRYDPAMIAQLIGG